MTVSHICQEFCSKICYNKDFSLTHWKSPMPNLFDRLANLPYMPKARTWLLLALGSLLLFSLVMVLSASIPFAMGRGDAPLKFFWAQFSYMMIAIIIASFVYVVPLKLYKNFTLLMLVFVVTLVLLLSTLLFAEPINGSKRWLTLAGASFQTAELAKFLVVLLTAEFITRRSAEVRTDIGSLKRPFIWYAPILTMLFLQPDFGSVVVIGATVMVMFFVGGVPYRQFFMLAVVLGALGAFGMTQAEYRQSRLMSFLDPFDDVMDTDYQLARSLVAFGRGEFDGVGYGNSIQKLAHLPEAHTDFLLAITGEELGFLGVAFVIFLELTIVAAIMRISYNCLVRHQLMLSYTAFGFGVVIFGQVMINAGVNMGLLPTKGLTMPFFSYGGSAMLFSMMMIAIILKIDKESPQIFARQDGRNY